MKDSYDHGLKLFLDTDDLERLYDFEEESMEGLARERELKAHMSTDERVRVIGQCLDAISHKVEDTLQKSSYQNQNLQSLDFRLIRVEDIAEQLNSHMAFIQRLASFQSDANDRFKSDVTCDVTADEFRKQLDRKRPERVRTASSCAYDDGDDFGPPPPPEVHPQDLVLLESIGPIAGRHRKKKLSATRRRSSSETSLNENKIQATIEKAERELAVVSAGMSILTAPEELMDRPSLPTITVRTASRCQSYVDGEHDDDNINDEMFDCELQEIDDTVESSIYLRDVGTTYRSNSVGGNTELRKRNRNWSGTPTGVSAVSPNRRSHSLALTPVASKSVISSEEELSQPSDQLNEPMLHRQAVHGWPVASCSMCQRMRSSLSLVSYTPQPSGAGAGATTVTQPSGVDTPKMSLIQTSPLGYVTAMDSFPPLPRQLSNGGRANPANVEAEAEHLRQMEGQDYRRMEGIIRRRLHRDSENLEISLEDLCYAPIKDDTLDSLELPDMEKDVKFMLESSSFTSDDEGGDNTIPLRSIGKGQLKTSTPTPAASAIQPEASHPKTDVKITVESEE